MTGRPQACADDLEGFSCPGSGPGQVPGEQPGEEGMDYVQWMIFAFGVLASALGALHALFNKRDPRSAFAWVAICLMWPLVGAGLYVLFGKNRIQTRARRLHGTSLTDYDLADYHTDMSVASRAIDEHFRGLAVLSGATSGRPLLTGTEVELLVNGEEAYPAMLAAIEAAQTSVYLASYIFDGGGIGRRFIEALAGAQRRGVEVRVLIDGVGRLYSTPRAAPRLAACQVPVALYLPPSLLPPRFTINLRNHRKILVVDGRVAFTGGMNIRQHHLASSARPQHRTEDIHFRLCGPVVRQLQDVFVADWRFASSVAIDPPPYRAAVPPGGACARVITDGPNDDIDKLTRIIIAAIGAARCSIAIMTPYFLPSRELDLALQLAALRGVRVQVILPDKNNLPFVNWAAFHMLGEMLAAGVEFYLYTGPFVHSKVLVVDDYYVQIGSSNLDPRSLRLNFEVNVELYDAGIAAPLADYFAGALAMSQPLTAMQIARRPLPSRFAGGVFWLMSPFL